MNIKKVKISDIKIENRFWDVDDNTVVSLMESIKDIGLKTPPTVRPDSNTGQFILIAGNHRIEACSRLGMDSIDVIVDDVSDDFAILHEIDENLTRRAIHYAERGYQLNERKKAYERIFGAELSAQASFKRYFEDVKAIVENGKKTSRYDYTLFNEEDFNFDYIKDRVDKNQMEDLFGVYTDKNGNEVIKKLGKQDISVAKRLFPILKAINENVKYIPDFVEDVTAKLNLSEYTIDRDLVLGNGLSNGDEVELIKKSGIGKRLATSIATDKNKDGYLELIKSKLEDTVDNKKFNSFLEKSISEATKSTIKEFGKKDSDIVYNKTVEIVNSIIDLNESKGLNKFDTNAFKELSQTRCSEQEIYVNFDIEDKINKIAEIFNVDKTKLKSSIKKDKLQITINLKEIK